MSKTDDQLGEQAKEAFDRSVDGLDAATLSRLNRGRQVALATAGRPGGQWLRWIPATSVAAAVLLAILSIQGPGDIDVLSAPTTDLDILLGEESIEMLEELEFYSWLATQEMEGDGDLG
jgi:hypothetical protein